MTRYLLGISLLFLMACHSHEHDPVLKQAFEVHQVAIQTHDSLSNELNTLQAQSLKPEDQSEWKRLNSASEQWEESLVEVPGFEHAEGHDHDHHHHHHGGEALQDLPPSEMLRIQQALLKEVKDLLEQTRGLAARIPQST